MAFSHDGCRVLFAKSAEELTLPPCFYLIKNYFLSAVFSFVKINVPNRKWFSFASFSILLQIKNYVRSPRAWTVTDFSYSKLCHAALVGVDKETLATGTLGFPREGRRRNKLRQLNVVGHDRRYLSLCLDSTKES